MTATLTATQRLAAAVLRVCDPKAGFAPYFGVALRGLLRRQMPAEMEAALTAAGRSATLAVTADGVLYWAEGYVLKCTIDELAFVLMHETMHVLLDHPKRIKAVAATPEKQAVANLAADACINEELRKAWPNLGKDGVYPETLEQPLGLIFEERYRRLKQREPKDGQSAKGKGGGVGKGQCGGCGGEPLLGEKPGEGRSEAQLDRVRRETADAVKTHVGSKGRGTVPAGLEVWADALLGPPKIDWRVKLGQLVRAAVAYKAGMVDLSWHRPSRRQGGLGFGVGKAMLPAYRAPVPRVGVLVDTSGSMSQAALATAMTEVQGVLAACGGSVTFAVVDAALHGIKDVATVEQAIALLKGGGGTDLTEGFVALAERHVDVLIALTDGYVGNGYPSTELTVRTIWCVIEGDKAFTPAYGEVVHVDDVVERAA